VVNSFISSVLLGDGKHNNNTTIDTNAPNRELLSLGNQTSVVAEWLDGKTIANNEGKAGCNWIVLATYPEVAMRKLSGLGALLTSLLTRYTLFFEHHFNQKATISKKYNISLFVPPSEEFDTAFSSILRRFQDQLSSSIPTSTSTSSLDKKHAKQQHIKQQQTTQTTKKGGKKATQWHDGNQKITKAALAELDMSKDKDNESSAAAGDGIIREDARAIAEAKAAYMPEKDEVPAWEEEDEVLDEININWNADGDEGNTEKEGDDDSQANTGIRGFFSNLLSPNRPLTKSDLEPPLKQMQQLLTSKNVAPSTAKAICEVVEKQLLGKKVGTLVGVKRAVRHALEDAIERILRPELGGIGGRGSGVKRGKSVDVLRGVVEKREKRNTGLLGMGGNGGGGRPYVIVMIGINGVGKSTSLAKIAYYLQSNQCNPLLAACDTFRSGAVEQLSVHASCLNLPLYHQGYAKDPSAVAKAAINKATEDGNDVVLVDTAGRMQNNVPLMKALAKLVTETSPDLVLFVCEALVGNDGMDQLTMFQKALSMGGHTRPIDGIVLTKFDTVSDKVGAALTLTHLTGVPIAFCGTGQKYNHLKPLSVPFVIQSLFSA
jgi:signal recognition particle receptor subunit alpha